ncbi:MAG: thioredoxin family protein, partial [Alphaproteobacteria bacterium]|nr:thioredoxin family protein [Alphaproteobacteria bacterium]
NTFLSGFFAVLIASPCTGPFLGAALGYTLMQSTKIYFIIFFSLGLGYAMPFTLLELYPKFVAKIMPSSGKWTLRIKYALSVPILFTCLWLAWVLCSQLNTFSNYDKKSIFRPYNTQEIRELINAKKPVFIEFTAKWCLTCLLNEKNVLNNPKFLSLIQEKNINTYRADWTDDDVKIGQAIKSFGRNSVPLYVYYPENSQQYVILPQILTLDNVKSIFNGQNKKHN